jgi:hypothetical protein
MANFYINRAFRLVREDGSSRLFPAGYWACPDDDPDLSHWYVRSNLRDPADVQREAEAMLEHRLAMQDPRLNAAERNRSPDEAVWRLRRGAAEHA